VMIMMIVNVLQEFIPYFDNSKQLVHVTKFTFL
jgi:hypothetical protein